MLVSKITLTQSAKNYEGHRQRVGNITPLDIATGSKPPDHRKEKHRKTHRKSLVNNSKSYGGI